MSDHDARSAFEARVVKLADELMAAHGRPAQIRAAVPARPDRAPESAILAFSPLSSQEHILLSSAQWPSPSQDSGREAPSLRLERELLKAIGASSRTASVEGSFSTPSLSGGAAVARWSQTPTNQPHVRGLVAVDGGQGAVALGRESCELVRRLEANAVGEALARLGWGGAEGVADVEVLGLGATDLAVVVLLLVEGTRADAHLGTNLRVVALAALGVVVDGEEFVLASDLAALADDVVNRAENRVDLEEELAWPIETEGGAHDRDHVKVPHELLAGRVDEPVGGVDLAFFAVSLYHLEADAFARVVEVG
eukprot:scaffold9250_cov105-Isochrysis_galbana.AAC.13